MAQENIIEIKKDIIPYEFDLILSEKTYKFTINYNKVADQFSVSLSYNDEILVQGERMCYGIPLFDQISHDSNENKDERFFDEILVMYDMSGSTSRAGYNEVGETVFLWKMIRDEEA